MPDMIRATLYGYQECASVLHILETYQTRAKERFEGCLKNWLYMVGSSKDLWESKGMQRHL